MKKRIFAFVAVVAQFLAISVASATDPSCTLVANPTTIVAGTSSTLSWQAFNGTPVLDNGIGTVPKSGSISAWPDVDTTYTMVVSNLDPTSTPAVCKATVKVKPAHASGSSHQLIQPPLNCMVGNYGQGIHYFHCTGELLGFQLGHWLSQHPDISVSQLGVQVYYNTARGYWLYVSDKHSYVDVGLETPNPINTLKSCPVTNFGGGIHFFGCTADDFGLALTWYLKGNPDVTVSGIGPDIWGGDQYGFWLRFMTKHGPADIVPPLPYPG